jgi:hypothetical protein
VAAGSGTVSIPFTQYLLPDGRTRPGAVERSGDIEEKARRIIDAGFRFEAEVLRTGEVSLTVFDPEEEVDVDIEIGDNLPGAVGPLVDRLVERFAATLGSRSQSP